MTVSVDTCFEKIHICFTFPPTWCLTSNNMTVNITYFKLVGKNLFACIIIRLFLNSHYSRKWSRYLVNWQVQNKYKKYNLERFLDIQNTIYVVGIHIYSSYEISLNTWEVKTLVIKVTFCLICQSQYENCYGCGVTNLIK